MEALIAVAVVALLVALVVVRSVRIVPQARARNVERLGRYHKTLEPGLHFIIPFVDRVRPQIDLREQVVSFQPQPVITEDNLVVNIDTVLYFHVTDARAAAYEINNFIQAAEQLTVTTLRNVIGGMDLEETLTSREKINSELRGVLDEATGKWGIRVNRVEIKAIDPPAPIKQAMEKQMRADRDKRAAILTAEGVRQSQILTAEGEKQSSILRAEGERQSAILKAEGQAQAIETVFKAVHRQRSRPQAAGLPVPPDPAPARPEPRQHDVGHPERGDLRPPLHQPGLRRGRAAGAGPRSGDQADPAAARRRLAGPARPWSSWSGCGSTAGSGRCG